jgi:hypothetical protein
LSRWAPSNFACACSQERKEYKKERNRENRGLVKREEGRREGMRRVKDKMQGKEGRREEIEERNIG